MTEERGKPEGKVLAVMFTEHGDPTSVRELNHLVETWGDVQEWHRLMLAGGDTMCGLDEFMRGSTRSWTRTRTSSVTYGAQASRSGRAK
jgi:hypothetical protein